jgi:hypothetical protein
VLSVVLDYFTLPLLFHYLRRYSPTTGMLKQSQSHESIALDTIDSPKHKNKPVDPNFSPLHLQIQGCERPSSTYN